VARATALCAFLVALVTAAAAQGDPPPAAPCVAAGLVAVLEPAATAAVTSGPSVATATTASDAAPSFDDPSYGVQLTNGAAGAAGCTASGGPGGTHAAVDSWSVFGGAVSGASLSADLVPAAAGGTGWHLRSTVDGLRVGGVAVDAIPGATVAVGNWGTLTIKGQVGLPRLQPLQWWSAALELDLERAHAGLPAGTVVLLGYAAANRAPARPAPAPATTSTTPVPPPATTTAPPTPPTATAPAASPPPKPAHKAPRAAHPRARRKHVHRKRRHPRIGQPLRATPPLGRPSYVFPVTSPADWGDTYGSERSDVPGGWHHGDDLFAPLGTPVVAVAGGTVFAVGWNRVGGWRLWLRDRNGNDFYYAHLSGYTQLARNGNVVSQGDVLGFVGNTGDAVTTEPHLHFEVHPNALLYLGYDGAVDPTTYLRAWPLLRHFHVLPPVALPGRAPVGFGSVTDYRRLLAVRAPSRRATVPKRFGAEGRPPARARANATAVRTVHGGPGGSGLLPIAFGVLLALGAAAAVVHTARDGRT